MTPEEKLLKIIEGGNPVLQKDGAVAVGKKLTLKGVPPMKGISLQTANRILIGACVGMTILYIVLAVKINQDTRSRFEQITHESEKIAADVQQEELPSLKPNVPLNDLFADIKEHNIFSLEQVPKGQEHPPVDYTNIMARLKLVGIIWADKPQAMIEDTQASKTYFVGEGTLIGTSKVKKILRDKVVISDGTYEWEIQ